MIKSLLTSQQKTFLDIYMIWQKYGFDFWDLIKKARQTDVLG